ncbi:MAG TPA: thiamine-phosphate kinase [Thermoplasmata archaeon]|nr:thiamine-phosphate kinase [Thermoplasmata archaeon]
MSRRVRHEGPPVRERDLQARLARRLPAGRSGLLPIGDDAAALRPGPSEVAVLTTDSLVEGIHFLRASDPRLVGAAAAAVSLSDVAAKGARPAGIVLALLLPVGTPRRWAETVVLGAERMGARFGAHVIGGDTKPGPARAVASTVIGFGRADALGPRTQARPGDLLVTTGDVGRGGLAARRLGPARRGDARALADLLRIRPRVREGAVLGPLVHAMMDTSDGLAESVRLLSAASGVRIVVEEERLPYAPGLRRAARSPSERRSLAFYGGDYELLAALPPDRWARAHRAVVRAGGRLTRIGRVERGVGAWLRSGAREEAMPPPGWDPFRGPSAPAGARGRVAV